MDSRPMVHLRNFHSNRVMRKVAEAAASIQSLPKFPARHYSTQTGCTRSNWSATPRKPRVSRGRSLTRQWVPRSIPEFPVPSQLSLSNWKFIRAEGIDTQRTQRERPMRELQIASNSDGKLSWLWYVSTLWWQPCVNFANANLSIHRIIISIRDSSTIWALVCGLIR